MSQHAFEKIASGRIIAFHAEFARLFGVAAGLFLSQAAYYDKSLKDSEKTLIAEKDVHGNRTGTKRLYFFHSDSQWLEETALTEYELRCAKNDLKANQVIYTQFYGQNPKNYYCVDLERLSFLLENPAQVVKVKRQKREINYKQLAESTRKKSQVQTGDIHGFGADNVAAPAQTMSQALYIKKENIFIDNDKDNKNIELSVRENCESSENVENSEAKEPRQNLTSNPQNVFQTDEQILNAKKISDIKDLVNSEKGTKKEFNKNTKTEKLEQNSDWCLEETPAADPRKIRAEITAYLAHKCFHAAEAKEMPMLTAKQLAQLHTTAQKLQELGIAKADVERWWKWFVSGGDFRGTNLAKAERNGLKVNTPPSVVVETWLAFKHSQPIQDSSATRSNTTDSESESVFTDKPEDYDVEESFEVAASITDDEDYETLKNNWINRFGKFGRQEVDLYEQSLDYRLRTEKMAA